MSIHWKMKALVQKGVGNKQSGLSTLLKVQSLWKQWHQQGSNLRPWAWWYNALTTEPQTTSLVIIYHECSSLFAIYDHVQSGIAVNFTEYTSTYKAKLQTLHTENSYNNFFSSFIDHIKRNICLSFQLACIFTYLLIFVIEEFFHIKNNW